MYKKLLSKKDLKLITIMTGAGNLLYAISLLILPLDLAYTIIIAIALILLVWFSVLAHKKHYSYLKNWEFIVFSIIFCIIPIYLIVVKRCPDLLLYLPYSVVATGTSAIYSLICLVLIVNKNGNG